MWIHWLSLYKELRNLNKAGFQGVVQLRGLGLDSPRLAPLRLRVVHLLYSLKDFVVSYQTVIQLNLPCTITVTASQTYSVSFSCWYSDLYILTKLRQSPWTINNSLLIRIWLIINSRTRPRIRIFEPIFSLSGSILLKLFCPYANPWIPVLTRLCE